MNEITLRSLLERYLDELGIGALLPNPDDLRAGIAELEAALMGLAFEAHEAEVRGVSFDKACQDENNFPRLNRLHHGALDILTLELPKELIAWVQEMFARPPAAANDLQIALGRLAADATPSPRRALARVLIFEGIRLSLLLVDHLPQCGTARATRRDGPGFVGLGIEREDVDRVAAEELRWWLDQGHLLFDDPRPLDDLFACALAGLNSHADEVHELIRTVGQHVAEELALRDELERQLQRMNAPDAVLIRNYAAPLVGEQRLSIERLQAQHPMLFGRQARNTVDQRMARLTRRLEGGGLPERRRPALIDLAAEAVEVV